jgi:putative DNA methylase
MSVPSYPKRLIEVDLPIARISAHARREKNTKHGHISTLHIWWARRPLAACRAVICAALWPDPGDLGAWLQKGDEVPAGDCIVRPARFLETAQECMIDWGKRHLSKVSAESYPTFIKVQQGTTSFQDPNELRRALLDFIADFANWDNSTDAEYLETARKLTQAAHETLGGEIRTRPLVADPFAGGGAIPLEALRIGADTLASDLNPVPVLLNKVILEYIPKYGQRLADEVKRFAVQLRADLENAVKSNYFVETAKENRLVFFWARAVTCEGPACGFRFPLLRSLWLRQKPKSGVAFSLKMDRSKKSVGVELICFASTDSVASGTSKQGAATCPACGYTTAVERIRNQLSQRKGGAADAMLLAVCYTKPGEVGKFYRLPTEDELQRVEKVKADYEQQTKLLLDGVSVVPNEKKSFTRFLQRRVVRDASLGRPLQSETNVVDGDACKADSRGALKTQRTRRWICRCRRYLLGTDGR